MNFSKWLLIFLVINFGALYIGNLLMNNGPQTEWYINLNKAPWTPPGWVFGAAWTFIMICFSIYLAKLIPLISTTSFWTLFSIQFILNVSWNYVFFAKHLTVFGLILISILTCLVLFYLFNFYSKLKLNTLLIAPYAIWLCIATSLNFYIVFNN